MATRTTTLFLLGALISKLTLNESNHLLHGITIAFPSTKAWIPCELQRLFGGSIFTRAYKDTFSVRYTLKSRTGICRLLKVLKKYSNEIPGLTPAIKVLSVEQRPNKRKQRCRRKRSRKSNQAPPTSGVLAPNGGLPQPFLQKPESLDPFVEQESC